MDESQAAAATAATAELLPVMVAHSTTGIHLRCACAARGGRGRPHHTAIGYHRRAGAPTSAEVETVLIDRASRDALIDLLTDFAAGRISREELFAGKPKSPDAAVREILAQASLFEAPDERAPRTRNLSGEDRSEVVRWMLFLETGAEYRWPSLPRWLRVVAVIPSILTFGLIWRPYRRWFERQGDHRVWPFLDATEHRDARRNRRGRAG